MVKFDCTGLPHKGKPTIRRAVLHTSVDAGKKVLNQGHFTPLPPGKNSFLIKYIRDNPITIHTSLYGICMNGKTLITGCSAIYTGGA
jgi:hypothetical protein